MEKKIPGDAWVSSRELMERHGISRATLNNYIKAGLLPHPAVGGAREGMKGTKQIGYFPPESLHRMEEIRRLKDNGRSMEEICRILSRESVPQQREEKKTAPPAPRKPPLPAAEPPAPGPFGTDIPHPACYMNRSLRILWVNDRYRDLFPPGNEPGKAEGPGERALFPGRLWDAWKERWTGGGSVLDAHLAMIRTFLPEERLLSLFGSVPDPETGDLLGQRALRCPARERGFVLKTFLGLEKRTGGEELFELHGLCCREGILFVWERADRRPPETEVLPEAKPLPADRGKVEIAGDFIVLTARLGGRVRLCSELPSREYGELIGEIGGLLGEEIGRHGGIPGHFEEDRIHGYFPWSGFKGNIAGKAITCAVSLRNRLKEYDRARTERKKRDLSLSLGIGVGWGTGTLREEGSPEKCRRSFAGEALHRSTGLAAFAPEGSILAMKELVEKAENDRCSFHYGVLKKKSCGEKPTEGVFFRIMDLREGDAVLTEEVREAAFLAIAEIFGERKKE
jgi:DNA-binding transcriptional MerR regulator/class 3 adenylate cyclase